MEAQAASAGPFPVSGLTPPTKRNGVKRRIGDVIVQLGFAERELVEQVVENGRREGVPLATAMIDVAKARRYQTIPIAFLAEHTLLVATADPANLLALDDITMATGYEVRRAVA